MEFSKYQIFEELHRALFFSLHGVLHKARFIKAYGVLKIINFIKPSVMECSMAQYLQKGVELLENFPFEELHRAHFFYGHGVLHEARFIKAYGVLKIINSVKHSIMQISFFYDGVLHKATFINEYGVLKLSIVNKLHVVLFFLANVWSAPLRNTYLKAWSS